jgi:hypothetical protein
MKLFEKLMSKVFGSSSTAVPAPTGPPISTVAAVPAPKDPPLANSVPASPPPGGPAPTVVDVAEILDDLAARHRERLDWRKSIVDLMKLVDMDSSLAARKELAAELDYPGSASDSAKMNLWLHKEVIKRIAANGGKVPADLLD